VSCPIEIGKKGNLVKRRQQQPLPGNDGKWFLELVGAVVEGSDTAPPEPAPPTEDTTEVAEPSAVSVAPALPNQPAEVAGATATVAPPTTIDVSTTTADDPHEDEEYSHATQAAIGAAATLGVADAPDASRSEAAPTEVLEPTPPPQQSDRVTKPPEKARPARQSPTLDETWRATPLLAAPPPPVPGTPQPPSSAQPHARRSRWPLVVTVAAAVVAIVVAALLLPTLVNGRASDQAAEYRTALVDVRESLVTAQQGLADATEPSSQDAELQGVPPQVRPLADAAGVASGVAAEPLPDPLPLLPSGSIDDLGSSRDAVAAVGAAGTDIAARINDTTVYRLLLGDILLVPELPLEADDVEIAGLSAELAAVDTESRNAAAQLPSDPVFADHKVMVTDAVAGFDEWVAQYLGALTAGDAALAAELIGELEATQLELTTSLVPALRAMRNEVDVAMVDLYIESTAALAALP
jgi:hypothetical protein